MLRTTISGCGEASTLSAKVRIHLLPGEDASVLNVCICGRLRRMRIACPLSSIMRLTSPMMAPPLARIGSRSIGCLESNTSHTVSPRRNEAAGVASAKLKVRRSPSLSRTASSLTGAPAACEGASGVPFCTTSAAAGLMMAGDTGELFDTSITAEAGRAGFSVTTAGAGVAGGLACSAATGGFAGNSATACGLLTASAFAASIFGGALASPPLGAALACGLISPSAGAPLASGFAAGAAGSGLAGAA
ncbi:MAG: hypothetical protein ACM3JG_02170, partial [Thiohalocapsa sp.]